MEAAGLFGSDYFDNFRDRLASDYGGAIIDVISKKLSRTGMQASISIAAKNISRVAADRKGTSNLPEIGSTHIRIKDKDGELQNFILTLRPYFNSAQQKMAAINGQVAAMKTGTTWLALSPDRFYLHDENGKEMWPVTFPAVSLEDSTKKIMLTFNKDGFVSSTLTPSGNTLAHKGANTEPNIVFIEATPVIEPKRIEPCVIGDPRPECYPDPPPPPPPGSSFSCQEVSGRGEIVKGPTNGMQTYFTIDRIRLVDTGDGDGAAELQMFVKNDDQYDGECFPRSYLYRFDHHNWFDNSTPIIRGADGKNYIVPDVDYEDVTYGFQSNGGQPNYFPLIDLTNNPGSWRLVLIDTDRDYADFSRRRNSNPQVKDVWTYDMNDGNWKQTTTGFSSDSHHYGSSDDPILESGVRRITINNVNERSNYSGKVNAQKGYGVRGYFKYRFFLLNK